MGHDHHHHITEAPQNITRAYAFGIALNFSFVVVEAGIGAYVNSLSLISDAGHNLADVGTLALSLLAFRLLRVKSSKKYTYGYRKTSILVALINSLLLLVTVGGIVYEAVHRLLHPEPTPGFTIALVAGIGIVINATTALLFLRNKEHDLNIKGAYLHMVSDALVSAGIVVGGIVIYYTQWFWLDSALGIIIALIILNSTWQLLKDSLRLSLDGVPVDIKLEEIRMAGKSVPGVRDLHHIHIWAISTTENALTAHLVLPRNTNLEDEHKIKHDVRHALKHKNIQHITLETEREDEHCEAADC